MASIGKKPKRLRRSYPLSWLTKWEKPYSGRVRLCRQMSIAIVSSNTPLFADSRIPTSHMSKSSSSVGETKQVRSLPSLILQTAYGLTLSRSLLPHFLISQLNLHIKHLIPLSDLLRLNNRPITNDVGLYDHARRHRLRLWTVSLRVGCSSQFKWAGCFTGTL
jgi:hypothetical protein